MNDGEKLKRLVKMDDRNVSEIAKAVGLTRTHFYRLFKKPFIDDYYIRKLSEIGIQLKKEAGERNLLGEGIPIYETQVSGGGIEMYNDIGERPSRFVTVPGLEDCDFGMFVFGHSMYPTIENGAMILAKKVSDKEIIIWGEIYVVLTGDHRMVKRLQKSAKNGHVICASDNQGKDKRYESFELKRDKIRDLYIVKGIVKKIQS